MKPDVVSTAVEGAVVLEC